MKKPRPIKKRASTRAIDDSGMEGQDFWMRLQKLGFSQQGFARTINVSDRTVRAWIGGRYPVPTLVAMFVNLMLKTKSTAEDLRT